MIEKLENNDQILLMYLAGELPAEDQAHVERMIASEPSIQRTLHQLQALYATVGDGMGRLDEIWPMPVNADFAVRQVSRAMRQQMARPKAAPATAAIERAPRSWWWLYPTVAAASIAIIAMVWLNRQATSRPGMPSTPGTQMPFDSQAPLANAQNSNEVDDELLIDSLDPAASSDHSEARPAEEDTKQQLASGDTMAQDEISQYLLSATAAGQ